MDRTSCHIVLLLAATVTIACETGASPHEYVSDAQRAAEAGRLSQAETLADRAVEKGADEDDAAIREVRAAILRGEAKKAAEADKLERAAELFEQAAQMEPDEQRAARDYLRVAELRLKLGDPPGKIAPTAEKAIDLNPAMRDAYRLAGRLWDRAGKARRAISHYLWAFEADRSDTQIGARLGALYRQTDQPWDAIAIYERVLEHAPDHVQARVNLAELYEEIGSTDKAESQFETLLEKHPESAGILRRYAEFLRRQGDAQRAREVMQKARDAMPGVQRREMRELE